MSKEPEYDAIILDLGGDDLVTLSGPLADPQEVSRVVEKYRADRLARLVNKANDWQRDLFARWADGREPIYAVRMVPRPDQLPHTKEMLVIYIAAPALREAITAEVNLGASPGEVEHFASMSLAGMVFGTFTSTLVPDGEPGSVHVCDIDREITHDQYDAARRRGWAW